MQDQLTAKEKELIMAASDVQLNNLIELHGEGHVEFDHFLQEYEEVEATEIAMEILENVISFEELKNRPERIWHMTRHSLLAMQFIILKMLPQFNWDKTKRVLYHKLQKCIEVQKTQLN